MKPLKIRYLTATGFLLTVAALSVVSSLIGLSAISLLEDTLSTQGLDLLQRASRIDAQFQTIRLVQLPVYTAAGVAFIAWFYRAHQNLQAKEGIELRYTPGWTIAGFLVPLLNLVRPYQVMSEVWMGSNFVSRHNMSQSKANSCGTGLVIWWWALFLGSSFIGRFADRLVIRADSMQQLGIAALWGVFADLIEVVAAGVALLLLRRITTLQDGERGAQLIVPVAQRITRA